MLPLVLYDIPSKLPGKSWSPNPAKPRFVLSYKNLPFEIAWVELPDIAPKLKEIGASPTKRQDGSELYTLPVLSDPNSGSLISDSWMIAEYLDKTYPEKPIFPNGSKGLIRALNSAMGPMRGDSFKFTYLRTSEILNERSRECLIAAREAGFGEKVDEWSPEGRKRDAHWEIIENDFYGSAKMWYESVGGEWMMGNTFSYADIILATITLGFKRVCREGEWKKIASLHNGKWEKLLARVEKKCNIV